MMSNPSSNKTAAVFAAAKLSPASRVSTKVHRPEASASTETEKSGPERRQQYRVKRWCIGSVARLEHRTLKPGDIGEVRQSARWPETADEVVEPVAIQVERALPCWTGFDVDAGHLLEERYADKPQDSRIGRPQRLDQCDAHIVAVNAEPPCRHIGKAGGHGIWRWIV